MESASGSGRLRHLDDVTDVVRRDVSTACPSGAEMEAGAGGPRGGVVVMGAPIPHGSGPSRPHVRGSREWALALTVAGGSPCIGRDERGMSEAPTLATA